MPRGCVTTTGAIGVGVESAVVRDRDGRVTLTRAETTALRVVVDAGSEGALLSGATRPKLGQIESRTGRRLARQGLLVIDAGGGAQLTDQARELLS